MKRSAISSQLALVIQGYEGTRKFDSAANIYKKNEVSVNVTLTHRKNSMTVPHW